MAGEILPVRGTRVVWDSGGGNERLDLGGLASDAVRVGSYRDFGVSPAPDAYYWELFVDGLDAGGNVGTDAVDLYITESQDPAEFWTGPEIPVDITDQLGSINRLPNLKSLGSAVVVSGTAADAFVKAGSIQSSARYIAPVVHNATSQALKTAGETHRVILTPVYYQSQP